MPNGKGFILYKKLLTFFISIVIFLGAYTMIQYQSIEDTKKVNAISIQNIQDNEWKFIWSKINSLRTEAKQTTAIIAGQIKQDILTYYGTDKLSLRKDLSDYNRNNHPIVNIFAKNILGFYFNGVQDDADDMWIARRDAVVSDFSVDCSSDGRVRIWDKEIALHFNKVLAKKAIEKILQLDNGLIGWQFATPEDARYTFSDFTEENLKNLYFKYGLDSLKSFEICTPTYIDTKKDLNGDYLVDEHGALQLNSQIIVNQGFNIVAQLKNSQDDMIAISNFSSEISVLKASYDGQYILSIVVLISTFGMTILIFIIGSVLLNKEYERLEHESSGECGEDK